MIAKLDEKNYNATLDNNSIKAIRFVAGYNIDLRHSLRGHERDLYDFIDRNAGNIFGVEVFCMKNNDFDRYEKMIKNVVMQVCR